VRIAIVGAGIAGLGTGWLLRRQGIDVTLFEAAPDLGGHSHTVDVTLDGSTHPVDTGFLVFNTRTYPRLVALFDALGVSSVPSDMSFACRVDAAGVEWGGSDLSTVFAQRRNMLRPAFHRMLADILRFNRRTTALLSAGMLPTCSLGDYLERERYGAAFRDWYLLPLGGSIWSSPRREMLDFPLVSFARFCHNHGLMQIFDRPQWRTVQGGSRTYVERIAATLPDVRRGTPVLRVRRRETGVRIDTAAQPGERFDGVVLACHSDQALAILGDDASHAERHALSRIRYQPNRVVLHTDAALLPRRRSVWSAWNYLAVDDAVGERPVAVSYLINKLQPLPFRTPVIVTLNPPFEPARAHVLGEYEYAHPLLDGAAVGAQAEFAALQGQRHTWFAGAWLGYGFHEDGLRSAHDVAAAIAPVAAQRRAVRGQEPIAA
jgi:predicted NAD/FAD-binding protein